MKRYENKNDLTNAVTCMVECSKSFKTAAYFSAAHTRQEDIGTFLSADNLELKSANGVSETFYIRTVVGSIIDEKIIIQLPP